jgi:V8-like Glu-specific endopeptidase
MSNPIVADTGTLQRVPDTTVPPYCWVGVVIATMPGDSQQCATATLLDANHILTCAHIFSGPDSGTPMGWAFIPGANCDVSGKSVTPYTGRVVADWAAPDEWKSYSTPSTFGELTGRMYDYAVAKLAPPQDDEDVTAPGSSRMTLDWPSAEVLQNLQCTILGYSQDVTGANETLYTRSGPVQVTSNEDFLAHTMECSFADSGGPVFYQSGGNSWTILGVNSAAQGFPPDGAPPGTPPTSVGYVAVAMNEDVIISIDKLLKSLK